MKFALVNSVKTHIKDVSRGMLGADCWHTNYAVIACKGKYRQYWKYLDTHPPLKAGYENETEWHAAWKSAIKDDFCEVVMGDNNEHRADIYTLTHVIELQYSSIDIRDVIERNKFYNNITDNRVIWIINVYKAQKDKRILTNLDPNNKHQFFIKWKHPKLWVLDICRYNSNHIFLDISPTSKNLIKIWYHNGQLYGIWFSKEAFYDKYLAHVGNGKNEFLTSIKNININDYI